MSVEIRTRIGRRRITINGIVQGVGFRPHVYRLAEKLRLSGFVINNGGTVLIEAEGSSGDLDEFVERLKNDPPPLALIQSCVWSDIEAKGDKEFLISSSENQRAGQVLISPDIGVCKECSAEITDPRNRRFNYPFANCTNCGPRLTIIKGAPYDRSRTTMAQFEMCDECRREYENPLDRRFHAQPIACPACGPRLSAINADSAQTTEISVAAVADALLSGKVCAVKGLGGFHFACDARNENAVRDLRRRKLRDEKPFAIMVGNIDAAAELCHVNQAESALLCSSARPIVLLTRRDGASVAFSVAFGNPLLGVMLPYTPLHELLMKRVGDIPLVMTSGNVSDEPITYRDTDACEKLFPIADLIVTHNRPIYIRCDDSVVFVEDSQPLLLRRSRGYAPAPVELPLACTRTILATGGQMKNVFAMGNQKTAVLSHHIGDLDHYEAYRSFREAVEHYQRIFDLRPELVAHDLHDDYMSTRYAFELGLPRIAVQHHHAHLASCMAENGLTQRVIGVIFDGTGLGTDGKIWGGEFLVGDLCEFTRAAHFRYVPLPGGEKAIREPWRTAASYLHDAECDSAFLKERLADDEWQCVASMLRTGFNSPQTSSCGRLFDAVASLLGVRDRTTYEGQAAIELEWLATGVPPSGCYPFEVSEENGVFEIDARPAICAICEEVQKAREVVAARKVIARRWHATVAAMICSVCERLRVVFELNAVALSGGVFCNRLLFHETVEQLECRRFNVFRHRLVPANDGGLCLGQLAVAAAQGR